jgi:hypothetical protein
VKEKLPFAELAVETTYAVHVEDDEEFSGPMAWEAA